MWGNNMKALKSTSVILATLVTFTLAPLGAMSQDSFGPSRKPRTDTKYGSIMNPDALRDVFVPLSPQAAVDKVLLSVNGKEGAQLLGQFYVGDQTYSKISANPSELGAQPAGQIVYAIGDSTLPNTKICSKDRKKVYLVNAGSILGDMSLAWSLILDKSQVTEQYFPNGASALGRLLSMKDFMTHMQPYVDVKSLNSNTAETRERKLDVALLGALADMIKAQIDGDKEKYEFAESVLTSACSNQKVLDVQLNKMMQAGQYFKIGQEELSILQDSATPASSGLPKISPMSEVAKNLQAILGLSREPLTLNSWISSDGKLHVNSEPQQGASPSKFWIIPFSELSSDFTKCHTLDYTILIDPYTLQLNATGFIISSGKFNLYSIARSNQTQVFPFGEFYSDFQSAMKIMETKSATPAITLPSTAEVNLLNAFLLFQSIANVKISLMENNTAKLEKMKKFAKDICDPATMAEVHQEMTGRVFKAVETTNPSGGGIQNSNQQ